MTQSRWSPDRPCSRPSQNQKSKKVHPEHSKKKDCLNITVLSRSSWGTTKECFKFDKGKHGVFVGIEHRQRGDEAQGFKIAADDAKTTKDGDEFGW